MKNCGWLWLMPAWTSLEMPHHYVQIVYDKIEYKRKKKEELEGAVKHSCIPWMWGSVVEKGSEMVQEGYIKKFVFLLGMVIHICDPGTW